MSTRAEAMIFLRKPKLDDKRNIEECYKRSAFIHQPWVYPPKDYQSYLADENRYFLCLDSTEEIVGAFNISGIVRGYFQSGYLGYEVFSPHDGNGYMAKGLQLLLTKAFTELKLHRLEANIQPDNMRSIK